MKRDPLATLLSDADAGAPPPARPTASLTARVLAQAARRRRRLIRGVSAAAVVLLATGGYWLSTKAGPAADQSAPADDSLAAAQREVSRLRAEVAASESVVRQLRAAIDRRDHAQRVALARHEEPIDPALLIETEVEKAACNLVGHADWLLREMHEPEPASREYRRVLKLFPGSRWSGVARQRLRELESVNGETL